MKTRLFLTSLSFLVTLTLSATISARASVTPPSFPSCPNPGGILKVKYDSGTHGIPGDPTMYTGFDSVYIIDDSRLIQCFCSSSSNSGIQTNWWKINSLDQDEIDTLKNLGWVFIPDGSAWGLEQTAYLAYNSVNSCAPSSDGGFSPSSSGPASVCTAAKPPTPTLLSAVQDGSTATLTWTAVTPATHYLIFYGTTPGSWQHSVPNTGNVTSFTITNLDPSQKYQFELRAVNDCQPGDPAGQVLGASTFAPTGNISSILFVAALGLIFLGLSLLAKKHESRRA